MNKVLKLGLVSVILLITYQCAFAIANRDTTVKHLDEGKRSLSIFPILIYDSDIGFGFGGKGVIKNQFKREESFDLTIFGSSKGEQWYVFAFSIPDLEIRQRTAYPIAFDLKLEFDKYLKSNFFGFGNDSKDNDWQFPLEFAKLELTLSRGIWERFIGEFGLVFNHTSVYGYEMINPILSSHIPGSGEHLTNYCTFKLRWDTRDSQINPHQGWKLAFISDFSSRSLGSDFNFERYRVEINKYQKLFTPSHILAIRISAQHLDGTGPYYEQSIIGGGWTARGFKANRFIDRAFTISSIEYRFPIYRKLGGVLFVDSGRVYPGIKKMNFDNWKTNCGLGLRYFLTNFVVRFDAGTSNEGTRIFFNFGQVF